MDTPLPSRLRTLSELLRETATFTKTGDAIHALFVENGRFVQQPIAEHDVHTVDPRLPAALSAMFEHATSGLPRQTVFSTWINNTLYHWNDPLTLVDAYGATRYIQDITGFMVDDSTGYVTLYCFSYPVHSQGDIAYVTHTENLNLTLPFDYLETVFPGCRTKYAVVVAMGMLAETPADKIFELPVPLPSVSMTDVAFE